MPPALCFETCCDGIGFDGGTWSGVTSCFDPATDYVTDIAHDITLLEKCKLIFAGNFLTCGNAVRFSTGDWPAIKDWIEAGGRMMMAAEHSGNFPDGSSHLHFRCLQDMTNLNAFLLAIGSTISYLGGDYFCAPAHPPLSGCQGMMPGTAKIALATSPPFQSNRFGELTGGTAVWQGLAAYTDFFSTIPAPTLGIKTVVAGEKLGNGFFFLTGDGDDWSCLDACDFTKRLYNTDDADMI